MHDHQIKNDPAPLGRGGLEECTPEARNSPAGGTGFRFIKYNKKTSFPQ